MFLENLMCYAEAFIQTWLWKNGHKRYKEKDLNISEGSFSAVVFNLAPT